MFKGKYNIIGQVVSSSLNRLKNKADVKKRNKTIITLIALLFVFQTMDFVLTWYGLNIAHNIVELNIFMVFLFRLSFIQAIFIRLLTQITVSISFYYLGKHAYYNFQIVMTLSLLINAYILYRHGLYTLMII